MTTKMRDRVELYAFILTLLVVAAVGALTATHNPVPDFLTYVGTTSLGGALGLSYNSATTGTATDESPKYE